MTFIGAFGAAVLAACAVVSSATPHEVLLPSAFGVLPQPYAAVAPLQPPLPSVLLRSGGVDLNVPVVVPPVTSVAPAAPQDHVSPVLRAGSPAILLLPQTTNSGVYHLSDTHHQFPPFLENVVNRVQNLFSSYVQIDPFNVPFTTARPLTPLSPAAAAISAAPSAASTAATPSEGSGSTAAITTTTTTTTTAKTQGRGINLRLLAPGHGHSAAGDHNAPVGLLPRDVELLDGRLQQQQRFQQQHQVVSAGDPGQQKPVAFASATAQVLGADNEVDGYLPPGGHRNDNKKQQGGSNVPVNQRPPPPPSRPPSSRPGSGRPRPDGDSGPYGPAGPAAYGHRGGPVRRPGHGPGPAESSYYRRP